MIENFRKITALLVCLALLVSMVPFLTTQATDSFARVTISDSSPEATGVTYTVDFQFQQESSEVTLTFDEEFRSRNGVITDTPEGCTVDDDVITCTGTWAGQSMHTLVFEGMRNPDKDEAVVGVADTYTIQLLNNHGEWGNAMFAIIEPVTVTARVSAILQFTVEGVEDTETLHGESLDITTLADAIEFGTLDVETPLIAAQDLSVTTNASDGYTVTVFQDQDLTSPGGDTIKAFEDATVITPAGAKIWEAPSGTLGDPNTWGHFGFTTQDNQVAASCIDVPGEGSPYFDGNVWAGFDGTGVREVMCHTGPSDGEAEHIGTTRVGYQIEISPLQPAGEYTNTLTYIATPTF